METNRLRYYCVVVETGSLTKASEIVGVSHSGLSKAISSLQTETGLIFFRPLGRGLEITEDGQWFYKKALEILRLENEIQKGRTVEKKMIRIGMSEVLSILCSPEIAEELQQPISFVTTDVGEIETQLKSNAIDFGISLSPSPQPGLEYLEIAQIKLNSFCRSETLQKFGAEHVPFVVPATEITFNLVGYKSRDSWPAEVPRKIQYSATSFSTALNLLQSGIAAMYLPEFVVEKLNQDRLIHEKIVKISEHKKTETHRKIFLVKSKQTDESVAIKKVTKVIRKMCR